eukprot:6195586-Pleurochrysis_carterae.AAC.3
MAYSQERARQRARARAQRVRSDEHGRVAQLARMQSTHVRVLQPRLERVDEGPLPTRHRLVALLAPPAPVEALVVLLKQRRRWRTPKRVALAHRVEAHRAAAAAAAAAAM